jgi:hypothetical protein
VIVKETLVGGGEAMIDRLQQQQQQQANGSHGGDGRDGGDDEGDPYIVFGYGSLIFRVRSILSLRFENPLSCVSSRACVCG